MNHDLDVVSPSEDVVVPAAFDFETPLVPISDMDEFSIVCVVRDVGVCRIWDDPGQVSVDCSLGTWNHFVAIIHQVPLNVTRGEKVCHVEQQCILVRRNVVDVGRSSGKTDVFGHDFFSGRHWFKISAPNGSLKKYRGCFKESHKIHSSYPNQNMEELSPEMQVLLKQAQVQDQMAVQVVTPLDQWLEKFAPEIRPPSGQSGGVVDGEWAENGRFYRNDGDDPEVYRDCVVNLRKDVDKLIEANPEIQTNEIRMAMEANPDHSRIYNYYNRFFMIFTERHIKPYYLPFFQEMVKARRAILDGADANYTDAQMEALARVMREKYEESITKEGGGGGSKE